jgi:hypothetical protein
MAGRTAQPLRRGGQRERTNRLVQPPAGGGGSTPLFDTAFASGVVASLSLSHSSLTVGSNSNRALYVCVAIGTTVLSPDDTGTSPVSVTWNGVALTALGTREPAAAGTTHGHVQWYRLVAPATGAQALAITVTAAHSADWVIAYGAVSLYNVDQTTPETVGTKTQNDNATAVTDSETATAGNLLMWGFGTGSGLTGSTATQTERCVTNQSNNTAAGNVEVQTVTATGSSQTATVTMSTNDCYVGIPLSIAGPSTPAVSNWVRRRNALLTAVGSKKALS